MLWTLGTLLTQFVFWIFFFPELPTVIDGEPRESDLYALTILVLIFLGLSAGLILGFHGPTTVRNPLVLSRRTALALAVLLHLISAAAMLIQLRPVLDNPASLVQIFEPAGINRQAAELREAAFGVPTLVTLWIPSLALYLCALKVRYTRSSFLLALILFFSVFGYGFLMMSRTHIITAIFILFAGTIAFWPERLSAARAMWISGAILVVIWLNSLIRTGVLYSQVNDVSLVSVEVQLVLLQEFVEKYFGGEFNNSLIIATYESDPGRNFLYGTMFAGLSETWRPDRYLNTLNILGYYYWQFGVLGGVCFAAILGALIGLISRIGLRAADRGPTYYTLMFIVLFPGFFQSSRIQFFLLHYTIVPLVVFSFIYFFTALYSQNRIHSRS